MNNCGTAARGVIAAAAAILCAFAPARAQQTAAGTDIVNTATLRFDADGANQSRQSNTVSLVTAKVLDVTVTADRDTLAVNAGSTSAVAFLVANGGNAAEDYAITAASDAAGVSVSRIAVDTDNDGRYDPATDQLLPAGAALPVGAGQAQRLFVLIDGGQIARATRVSLAAAARTGSGAPGTVFPGAGVSGGDAVVGKTGAAATATTTLTIAVAQPTLTKSQSVFAPDGSSRAVRGAIITYRLVASFPGATRGVAIDDPIPAGTDYVPGSLTLDGGPLSDSGDADRGTVDAGGVHVLLGDVTGVGSRTIQFSVKIQ